jgi:xylulokinase
MAMVVTLDRPLSDPALRIPCQCHAVRGRYFLLPYGQTAGLVLKWFRDAFSAPPSGRKGRGRADTYRSLDALAAGVPAGSEGLVLLPHLMGAGSPEFNGRARGVFCGITPSTGKAHFARAILESVACMIRTNLECLGTAGIRVREIRALGGGARSPLWNRIKADCTGVPYMTPVEAEPTALGAAMLAGVGCGLFADLEEACRRLVRVRERVEPDPANAAAYDALAARTRALTRSLESYWS